MTKPDLRLLQGGNNQGPEPDEPMVYTIDLVAIGFLGTLAAIAGTILVRALRREPHGQSTETH